METRTFLATLGHLHEMLHWIRGQAEKTGFGPSDLYKIELAAEEALVNVIHHSYEGRSGEVFISVSASAGSIKVTISDSGIPFNPLAQKPRVDHDASLEERQMGGLGLLFIRKCLDEVSYQRKNDQNILTLIKKHHSR